MDVRKHEILNYLLRDLTGPEITKLIIDVRVLPKNFDFADDGPNSREARPEAERQNLKQYFRRFAAKYYEFDITVRDTDSKEVIFSCEGASTFMKRLSSLYGIPEEDISVNPEFLQKAGIRLEVEESIRQSQTSRDVIEVQENMNLNENTDRNLETKPKKVKYLRGNMCDLVDAQLQRSPKVTLDNLKNCERNFKELFANQEKRKNVLVEEGQKKTRHQSPPSRPEQLASTKRQNVVEVKSSECKKVSYIKAKKEEPQQGSQILLSEEENDELNFKTPKNRKNFTAENEILKLKKTTYAEHSQIYATLFPHKSPSNKKKDLFCGKAQKEKNQKVPDKEEKKRTYMEQCHIYASLFSNRKSPKKNEFMHDSKIVVSDEDMFVTPKKVRGDNPKAAEFERLIKVQRAKKSKFSLNFDEEPNKESCFKNSEKDFFSASFCNDNFTEDLFKPTEDPISQDMVEVSMGSDLDYTYKSHFKGIFDLP